MAALDVQKNRIPDAAFRRRLLTWYDKNRRALPWRENRDPYRVWVSEIMLQQTRVAAVISHYKAFLLKFPTVQALAAAREPSVLAAWSGLGYYRRAKMLHAASKQIVNEHGGIFPSSVEGWQELSGVGRYTAAAIASICFGKPVAALDGNVERVVERVAGTRLSATAARQAARDLLSAKRPGDWNQAMMELGATVCVPRQPLCLVCPISSLCSARGELPPKAKKPSQRKREIAYTLTCDRGKVFLVRRSPSASLMPGMWELPECSLENDRNESAEILTLKHSITVTDFTVRVVKGSAVPTSSGKWISASKLSTIPLTGLAQKILKSAAIMA